MAEFDALCERRRIETREQSYQTALVCASLFNAHGVKKRGSKKSFTPADFMADKPEEKPDVNKGDNMLLFLDSMAAKSGLNNAGEYEAQQRAKAAVNAETIRPN